MTRTFLRIAAWLAAILAIFAALAWGRYLSYDLDSIPKANPHAAPADLAYLKQAVSEQRGRILAVVSSAERGGPLNKKAGYELTELSRAYYAFKVNGYQVDVASPQGGKPPARIDTEDMQDIDYAFLNDAEAQAKVNQSIPLGRVDAARYDAVYFVGGKGAMFDLPGNADVARIVLAVAQRGVVGAVCHGPAALLGVTTADGKPFVAGKRMTGFTNDEELFLDANARARFPFLLQDRALDRGAQFVSAPNYLDHTIVDGRLVTGQNPWSTWSTVEAMIKALGHAPVAREPGLDENSVRMLAAYQRGGLAAARAEQERVARFDKMLVLMHALVAAMEWRLADAFQLQRLVNR
ncbi:type 1 glutamine amidotransferase domain-containing protein [Massilia sp. GCM10020059]|uniref:Type 1 glutamine amidotransferase domain-containing protein n=1 Tax=Massilia agrisoli TaxID=2892444 RepID=A0ABS8INS7_9BURK|nr:type 1 glutamine amidotransferase domain-containing protein [Massilia agrisoli]MCC6070229.1 type 1 glutamine amidotransferase domain-containing protein [Massilia agrisoli]